MEYNVNKTAQRIRELRIECKLSQKQLGDKVGVAPNTITQYESGYSSPKINVLYKLAKVLNTTSDYLLGLKDWE